MYNAVATIPVRDLADRLRAQWGQAAPDHPWERLTHFLNSSACEGFDFSDAAVVHDPAGQVGWACLAIRSPGRTALVLLGPLPAHDVPRDLLIRAIQSLARADARHGTRLVQALLPPDQPTEGQLLTEAGFTRLAELIYMQADLPDSLLRPPGNRDAWPVQPDDAVAAFDPPLHGEFAAAIQGSYVRTLDCPKLEGLRRIEDVIAGHQGSGLFKPELWFLFRRGGRAIGVVLLNEVADSGGNMVELVYMGLAAAARGQGLGRRMLHHAMRAARSAGYGRMMLAVDSLNVPALRLYARFGFRETMRRVAYVHSAKP